MKKKKFIEDELVNKNQLIGNEDEYKEIQDDIIEDFTRGDKVNDDKIWYYKATGKGSLYNKDSPIIKALNEIKKLKLESENKIYLKIIIKWIN